MSVEWRAYGGEDAILLVDSGAHTAVEMARPNEAGLKDYLAVSGKLERWRTSLAWQPVTGDDRDPDNFGDLVLSRAESGEVNFVDPELFWERVYRWFRQHGVDYNT